MEEWEWECQHGREEESRNRSNRGIWGDGGSRLLRCRMCLLHACKQGEWQGEYAILLPPGGACVSFEDVELLAS